MRRAFNTEKGYSAVEWFMVMGLLMLFSIAIFILAASSSNTYQQLIEAKEDDTELRIATSYVMTKLKQNDAFESIQVVDRLDLEYSAIMISELLLGEVYETWIYWSDGSLREATIMKNGKLDDDLSFVISNVDAFDVFIDENGALRFTLIKGSYEPREFAYYLKSKR